MMSSTVYDIKISICDICRRIRGWANSKFAHEHKRESCVCWLIGRQECFCATTAGEGGRYAETECLTTRPERDASALRGDYPPHRRVLPQVLEWGVPATLPGAHGNLETSLLDEFILQFISQGTRVRLSQQYRLVQREVIIWSLTIACKHLNWTHQLYSEYPKLSGQIFPSRSCSSEESSCKHKSAIKEDRQTSKWASQKCELQELLEEIACSGKKSLRWRNWCSKKLG